MLTFSKNEKQSRLSSKLDLWFWWIISLYPLLVYICMNVYTINVTAPSGDTFGRFQPQYFSLGQVLTSSFGISYYSSNFFVSVLSEIFGSAGIFPLFASNSSMLLYFAYFCTIQVIHTLVDVIIFIPRLSHKWIGGLLS